MHLATMMIITIITIATTILMVVGPTMIITMGAIIAVPSITDRTVEQDVAQHIIRQPEHMQEVHPDTARMEVLMPLRHIILTKIAMPQKPVAKLHTDHGEKPLLPMEKIGHKQGMLPIGKEL
jgi:hypothetical protein